MRSRFSSAKPLKYEARFSIGSAAIRVKVPTEFSQPPARAFILRLQFADKFSMRVHA